jgi:hypothetical protein
MRDKHFFSIVLLSLVLLPATAWTQTLPDNPEPARTPSAGWVRIQDLARGEEINVARGGTFSVPCRFAGATDKELFCDSLFSGREYRFSRAEVERVRMDDKRRNMRILVGSFAAAGLILGVAGPRSANDVTPRALEGLAGAGIGALAGLVVSVPAAFLIPGRLVYRHSPAEGKTGPPAPLGEQKPDQFAGGGSAP